MTFVKQIGGVAALGIAMVIGSGLSAPPAQAAYIVTLAQEGSNVVASGSGSLDVTDLTPVGSGSDPSLIDPAGGTIFIGPTSALDTFYFLISGPTTFGNGGITDGDTGSGDFVGVFNGGDVVVPEGYTSGAALTSNTTWDNQTFSSLGVTPGTYVWTWGSGATADSFTLDIAVPEPSSLGLLALPLGVVMLLAARRGRVNV